MTVPSAVISSFHPLPYVSSGGASAGKGRSVAVVDENEGRGDSKGTGKPQWRMLMGCRIGKT